jgi:lysophospholipase L1-like esterase
LFAPNGIQLQKMLLGILIVVMPIVSNAQTKIKLGCAGTSITYGTGVGQGYFVFLYPLIGTKYEIFNGGAGGSTTFGWLNSYGAPQIFNNTPDIVITEFAANDIRSDTWKGRDIYIANYNKIIDALQAMSSKPRVVIMLGPPVWSPNIHGIMADTMNLVVIPALKNLAAQRHLSTVDCYTPLLSHKDLFPVDGVHPSDAASDTMAHVVARFLLADTNATNTIRLQRPGEATHGAASFLPGYAKSVGTSGLKEQAALFLLYDVAGRQVGSFTSNGAIPRGLSTQIFLTR